MDIYKEYAEKFIHEHQHIKKFQEMDIYELAQVFYNICMERGVSLRDIRSQDLTYEMIKEVMLAKA